MEDGGANSSIYGILFKYHDKWMTYIFKKSTSIINDYLISAKLETVKVNPFNVTEHL